jgi:hypothetical protein
MLSFAAKRFDDKVPEPGELDGKDRALPEGVQTDMQAVGELYNVCKFRAALGEALALACSATATHSFHSLRCCSPVPAARCRQDRQCKPGSQSALVPDRRE